MKRDEFPVIAISGGDAAAIKKQFAKLRKVLAGIPLGPDPAIELKKTRSVLQANQDLYNGAG
jgi:hypothetical protein